MQILAPRFNFFAPLNNTTAKNTIWRCGGIIPSSRSIFLSVAARRYRFRYTSSPNRGIVSSIHLGLDLRGVAIQLPGTTSVQVEVIDGNHADAASYTMLIYYSRSNLKQDRATSPWTLPIGAVLKSDVM